MAVLISVIALIALDILLYVISGMKAVGDDPWMPAFIPAFILSCVVWIPIPGLKVLKPQEALVLTLFGNYIGMRSETISARFVSRASTLSIRSASP